MPETIIPYYPWPKSRAFHQAAQDPAVRVAAMITGAGYGKTYALCAEVIRQLLQHGHGATDITLPYLAVLIEPTYPMVEDVLVPVWFQLWPELWTARWLESKKKLITTFGAEVHFRSAHTKREINKWRGTRPNLIGLDEAREMDEYAFRLALNRVSFRQGKVLVTTTPNGFDWTYNRLEAPARANSNTGAIRCYTATAYDNPMYSVETLQEQLGLLGEDFYAQEVMGQRIRFSGRVYDAFDPARHIDAVAYNSDWPVAMAADFNVDPLSAILAHPLSAGGRRGWQIFDEIVLRHADTDQLCEEALTRYPNHKGDWWLYPDPTGGAHRTSSRGRSDHSILREWFPKGSLRARPPGKPAVRDRIMAVKRLLRLGSRPGEESVFVIDPKCKTLIQGLEQVAWKKNEPDEQEFFGHITAALGYMEEYERPFSGGGLKEAEWKPERREGAYA